MVATPEQIAAAEAQIVEQSKRIEFYITEYSVELLAQKMESGDFHIPSYQREFTWEDSRKSRFIESLLMGLPIPFLFFWESPNTGTLEIVDGSQRLRTIQQFVLGGMVLGPLDKLSAIEGLRFADLPESRRRKIKNRSIRGIVLSEHADEEARFDLFDRINTGSKIATKAEVRRGALSGPFVDLVIELSEDATFKQLAPAPKKREKLREREELVTRFFAYADGLEGYKDRPSPFLFTYTKQMNQRLAQEPDVAAVYRQRFHDTMAFIQRVFPFGFRRGPTGTTTPRARFEAIAIGSYLAMQQRSDLRDVTPDVTSWLTSKEFRDVTGSDGANAIRRLRDRIDFVRERLIAA